MDTSDLGESYPQANGRSSAEFFPRVSDAARRLRPSRGLCTLISERLGYSFYQPPPPPPPPPPPEDPPPPEPDEDDAGDDDDETALENESLNDDVKPEGEKLENPAPEYQEGEYPAAVPDEADAAAAANTCENCWAQACSTPSASA
jgi:hypothetical protein